MAETHWPRFCIVIAAVFEYLITPSYLIFAVCVFRILSALLTVSGV